MTKEEFIEEYKVIIYARRWWDFGELPPEKYRIKVWIYITKNPKQFPRGN